MGAALHTAMTGGVVVLVAAAVKLERELDVVALMPLVASTVAPPNMAAVAAIVAPSAGARFSGAAA